MSEQQLSAFRRALRQMPASIRALAREVGVSNALRIRVRDGERGLTPETVRVVVAALRSWGDRCHELAEALEDVDGPAEKGGTGG